MHTGLIDKRCTATASPIAWLTAFLQIGIFILIFLPLYNASASTGQVGDKDFLLDCTFNKYNNNTNYSAKFAKGWIPPEQKHRIVGDHIFFDSYYDKLKGKITKRNDERIEWTYLERPKDKRGKHYDAKRIYSYFFTTNKIATRLDFGTAYKVSNMSGVHVMKLMKAEAHPEAKTIHQRPVTKNILLLIKNYSR